MKTFKVWIPDYSETIDDAREIDEWDAEDAVKELAESKYQEEPFEGELTIAVSDGEVEQTFAVYAEQTYYMVAREI